MQTLIAYVPVLHEGYRRFFESSPDPKELFIVGPDIIADYRPLVKDLRQLEPRLMQKAVEALGIFSRVAILDKKAARALNSKKHTVLLPDEDVTRDIAKKYFPKAQKTFSTIFLRWDTHAAEDTKPVIADDSITEAVFHRRIIKRAQKEAEKSSDIWRRVGGAIVKDGRIVLVGHNRHLPSPHTPYVNGDPRGNFKKGIHIEIATGFHVEVSLIAEAARRGISLAGTSMYITTFPCPPCAKVIAHSGIKTLYFSSGYGVLDGEDILKSVGVRIVYVA